MRLKKSSIAILLSLLFCFSLCACASKQDDSFTQSDVKSLDAKAFLLEDWSVKDEEDAIYSYVILAYSDSAYGIPGAEDLRFLNDNGYESLMDAKEDVSVKAYPINGESGDGIYTYFKITSKEMLDTQKLYVYLAGFECEDTQFASITTKEAYEKQFATQDGWLDILVPLDAYFDATYCDLSTIALNSTYEAIEFYNLERNAFVLQKQSREVVNGTLQITYAIDTLKEESLDDFCEYVNDEYLLYHISETSVSKEGKISILPDYEITSEDRITEEALRFSCERDGDEVVFLFSVEGEAITDYLGVIPNAVALPTTSGFLHYFLF
jgi:hypothetical protein